jgi:hypothetical protein
MILVIREPCLVPVFRIHDVLVWIRILLMDADQDPAIFVIDLQDANKKLKKSFLVITF